MEDEDIRKLFAGETVLVFALVRMLIRAGLLKKDLVTQDLKALVKEAKSTDAHLASMPILHILDMLERNDLSDEKGNGWH